MGGRALERPETLPCRDSVRPLPDTRNDHVLIVDDEVLIALDLAFEVERMGATVIGPAHSVDEAAAMVSGKEAGLALLDIDVNGKPVWPLAEGLIERGWKVTFISADPSYPELRTRFAACRFINKPVSTAEVEKEVTGFLASRS